VITDPTKAIQARQKSPTPGKKETKNRMHLIGEGERRGNRNAEWAVVNNPPHVVKSCGL
jgi:hypothetical protein